MCTGEGPLEEETAKKLVDYLAENHGE